MATGSRLPTAAGTRADCEKGPRPCPWTECRYHLHREKRRGPAEREFSQETCALDLAERGPMSLWQVADAMGVSAEAVRQIEWKALTKLEEEQLLHKLWKRGVVDE